jgi:phenylalanyl-tRNA synthetase beta chain
MSVLAKGILDNLGIKKKEVFCAQVCLDRLLPYANFEKKFSPPAKYPAVTRDISFILKDEFSLKEVLASLQAKAGPLLKELKIADYYKGKQIPEGFKGLTISCIFRSDERTLTEEEVLPLYNLLSVGLTEGFQAKLR